MFSRIYLPTALGLNKKISPNLLWNLLGLNIINYVRKNLIEPRHEKTNNLPM